MCKVYLFTLFDLVNQSSALCHRLQFTPGVKQEPWCTSTRSEGQRFSAQSSEGKVQSNYNKTGFKTSNPDFVMFRQMATD